MASPPREQESKYLYETQAPCAQVLADLRGSSWKERALQRGLPILGIVAFVAFCLLVILTGELLWTTVGIVCGSFLLFHILKGRLESDTYWNLAARERREALVIQVVSLLQADIAAEELLSIRIDMSAENHADKLARTSQSPSGWAVRHYADPWLSLQGRLLEGTHFQLDMTDRLDARSRWKTSRLGRSKHKTKEHSSALVRLRLRVKPERYAHLSRLRERAWDAVRLPEGARIKALDVEADRLDLTVHLAGPWVGISKPGQVCLVGSQVVAMALLSLFHILHLSRAIDKKARLAG